MTSNAKAEGRFGKQDFRYVTDEDIYVCPAGEKLAYHYTTEENILVLRRYRASNLGQRFRGSNHIRRPRQACRTKCG
jgi:hypothetical protein